MAAEHEPATEPNDLARYFVQRANAGDITGLVALYTEDATLAFPSGHIAHDHDEISAVYTTFLASRPHLVPGEQRPALVSGDLALTSTILTNGTVTAEIARRGSDGSWRWAVDQPQIACPPRPPIDQPGPGKTTMG